MAASVVSPDPPPKSGPTVVTVGWGGVIYPAGVDERERRMAQNEALFREVNERVEDVAHQLGPDVQYEFVCECANADCTFRVAIPLPVYETIRADPKQFVVLPDHYTPEVEDLVGKEDSYWLVRTSGEAGTSRSSTRAVDRRKRLLPRGVHATRWPPARACRAAV